MKLKKDREQTVLKAYTTYWTSQPYPRKERTPKQAFIACAEWMQDEIDKLQKVIDKYARHLSSCDIFPLHAGGPAGPCSCELKDALSKAGIDKREAKGDGG